MKRELDFRFWENEEDEFWDTIEELIVAALMAGVIGGVGLLPEDLADSIDPNTMKELVVDFMHQYRLETFAEISLTTMRWTIEEIRAWREANGTIDELRQALSRIVLSKHRAESIAISEVTRLFAIGNEIVWGAAGLMARVWMTSRDELVCPICAPLDGEIVFMGMPFSGGVRNPPAHPYCRCWLRPALEEALIMSRIMRTIT